MNNGIKGAIVADTVRRNNVLIGRDVTFKLPDLTALTTDMKAMGNMTMPVYGLFENLEMSITKTGIDLGMSKLSRLEKEDLEFRWVRSVTKPDGSIANEGLKAFVQAVPTVIPGVNVEVGAADENEFTLTCTRIQIFINGVEYLLIDRLNQICRIDGTDYMKDIKNLL